MYSVLLGRFKNGARINVGYNPWSRKSREHDLSSICGRYGGGGHPFVGGISFPAGDLTRARHVAREIALELDA
jgi:nanoRNase/pAp phosphatase (c-di-AMP/oligoRNAs hydrolase)